MKGNPDIRHFIVSDVLYAFLYAREMHSCIICMREMHPVRKNAQTLNTVKPLNDGNAK